MCDCDKCDCKNADDCKKGKGSTTDSYCDCCDHHDLVAPD